MRFRKLTTPYIYCGENTVEYEEGFPVDTDSTFIAGIDFAKAGTLLRAKPDSGDADRQEYALGEAEDVVAYLNLNSHAASAVRWRE